MKGLANIPLLLGLALIIAITPLAIYQVQKNQNLQNRAAPELVKIDQVPCSEIISNYNQYCRNPSYTRPVGNNIPCTEFANYASAYCNMLTDKQIPSPSPVATCINGRTKCVGRLGFTCINQNWQYSKICN